MTNKEHVISLAVALHDSLVKKERTNGNGSYVLLARSAPVWMQSVVRAAHGDMLPDDWKYAFIADAAGLIAECDTDTDLDDLYCEPGIYTSDLLSWLASRNDRLAYVDDAIAECGHGADTLADIAQGQAHERQEVLCLLIQALEEQASLC